MSVYKLERSGEVIESEGLPEGELSCALGCFDGVHMGHRVLMETAVRNFFGYTPAVWTFLHPICDPFLETVETRLSVCGSLGIKTAVCEDFNEVKKMTPKEFVTRLHEYYGVRHFICGSDFRFGADRAGDADTLRRLAWDLGDAVTVVPPLTVEAVTKPRDERKNEAPPSGVGYYDVPNEPVGKKIGSTLLRKMIAEGEVEKAAVLLGRRFGVTAKVCGGKHIGRQMGMPTINQYLEKGRVVPAFGVYYSVAVFDGKEHPAVTNIGVRPTVNGDEKDVTCETHILKCAEELYGRTVKVELCRYARPEQKFGSLDELKCAIAGDIRGAKAFFGIDD